MVRALRAAAKPPGSTTLEHEHLLRHGRFLRGLAAHLVAGDAAADDLVQETWLAAIEKPAREITSPRGWLGTVVRNLARMGRREESRRRSREERAAAPEAAPAPPGDELVRRELLRDVVDAVLALDEPCQSAVLDRYWRGLGPTEIARRDGVPLETVRARLKRGLAKLRDRLDARSGGDRAAWQAPLAAVLRLGPGVGAGGGAGAESGAESGAGAGAGAGTAAGAGAAAGVLVMTVSSKIAVASAAGLVLALGLWFGTRGGSEDPASGATRTLAAEGAGPPSGSSGAVEAAPPIAAERFADPGARAEAARAAPRCWLALALDDGTALAGARIAVVSDGRVLASAAADALGVADLDPREEEVGILVVAGGLAPHRRRIRLAPGRQDVVVPAGAEVAGRVTVDGAVPAEPVTLWLEERTGWPELRELPYAAAEDLLGRAPAGVFKSPRTETGEGGRFRFRGLARDWRGAVACDGYAIAGREREEGSLPVETPRTDLAIDLHRLPRLRVRILDTDSRTPVAGARLEWLMRGRSDWSVGATADDAGRASRVVYPSRTDSVDLRAWSADGRLTASRSIAGPFVADRDLGDLALAAPGGRTIAVEVVDAVGRAVAGALAGIAPKTAGRTDAEGRATFVLPVEEEAFRVAAPGFRVATVPAPADPAEAVPVALQPANELEVLVTDPRDRPVPGAHVRISSEQRYLQDPHHGFTIDPLLDAAGPARQTLASGGPDGGGFVELMAGKDGRVLVWGIEPGVEVGVAVMDPSAGAVHEERVRLAPLENRRLAIRLPRAPRSFHGVVIGPDGSPASGAAVRIHRGRGSSGTVPTDREGGFRVDRMLAEVIHLDVEHPVAARWCDPAYRVPDGEEPVRIQLLPGNSIVLHVVDPDGRPVAALSAWTAPDGHDPDCVPALRDGVFRFEGLPPGRCALFALVGSKRHSVVAETAAGEARLVVPAHGSLSVRWDPALTAEARSCRLRVTRTDGVEPDEVESGLSDGELGSGAARVPALLPGGWSVVLESFHPDDAARPWHPLTAPVPLVIAPARETSVRCLARN